MRESLAVIPNRTPPSHELVARVIIAPAVTTNVAIANGRTLFSMEPTPPSRPSSCSWSDVALSALHIASDAERGLVQLVKLSVAG